MVSAGSCCASASASPPLAAVELVALLLLLLLLAFALAWRLSVDMVGGSVAACACSSARAPSS